MRKLFTLFLSVMFVSGLFAQDKPEAVIKKASVAPVIGGEIDKVWEEAEPNAIDKNFRTEKPTLGDPGETWWKALWNDDGIFVLVNVVDDDNYPYWQANGSNGWQYDHIELYIDVNYILEDGKGGQSPGNGGNYQIAPNNTEANSKGTLNSDHVPGSGIKYAFMIDDPNYVAEYFIPFAHLKDGEGIQVDKAGNIGFDVTVIDNDAPGGDNDRQRAVWANIGGKDESWNNMDDAGIITLEGAEPGVLVESIKLTGGSITTDKGTLQIVAEILPEDATEKSLKWTVRTKPGSTGKARISSTGVVTGILNGIVIVEASSADGSFIDANEVEVTISGQKPTIFDISYLKNGKFDNVTETGTPVDWTVGSGAVVNAEGVLEFGPATVLANPWDYKLYQRTNIPVELKDLDYIVSFKAWAEEPRTLPLIFEDAFNDGAQWDAYATSSDPNWSDKTWTVNLTTVPTVYSIVVNLSPMKATTQQDFNFQVGTASPRIYIDSIYMVSVADMDLIGTKIAQNSSESFKVYPNPAVSKLYVELTTANSTVAIYNSVGVIMEETIVNGTRHEFDVSRYTKGLYFVKANNKVVKFVK